MAPSWGYAIGNCLWKASSFIRSQFSQTRARKYSVWPWPVAAIPIALLGALVPFRGSLLLTAAYAVGILLLAALGTRAIRQPDTALGGAD